MISSANPLYLSALRRELEKDSQERVKLMEALTERFKRNTLKVTELTPITYFVLMGGELKQ